MKQQTLSMYVTSFSSISYFSNSEYWPLNMVRGMFLII